MFKNLLRNLNQKKVKVFSLFLLCSFLAWFLSNLSEPYESRCDVKLNYTNLPDTLLLGKNAVTSMEAKLRTSGFRFLFYNLFAKRLDIDVSQARYENGKYLIDDALLKKQIDGQLSQSISLLDLDRKQLVLDLYQVASKEIPIAPNLDLRLQQNFILDGPLGIEPSHVMAKGPLSEIDTLRQIMTAVIELKDIAVDFNREAPLVFPKGLNNTIFSLERVKISGKVVRFSEEIYTLSIAVINQPEGYSVKTFPNSVSVLCKAKLDRLKEISESDFEVVADYGRLDGSGKGTLYLELKKSPKNVYDVRLLENTVNFVLEQQ
ncbi:YbbR-like domain-containing protein [Flagellimonas meishanensis]|uniref:YbbR-like domain-containing protein n=1 Tax=Flagellimonas meishanensis TaxID=2873264 RepID=UPI001CA6CCEE|nr:YbbR-like domain-containing protein [[Muricauda] meishanensis]